MKDEKSNADNEQRVKQLFKKIEKINEKRQEETKLTRQFYKSLEAYYFLIKEGEKNPNLDKFAESVSRIEKLLTDERSMSWENAYLIEQLMIPLYNNTTLDVELSRRLVQAEGSLAGKTAEYYQVTSKKDDHLHKRALLKALLVDLQWHDQIQELKRVYSRMTRRNTGIVFVFSVILFVTTILTFEILIDSFKFPVFETMSIAMTAGLLGAAFSMLIGMRDRLQNATFDELKVQRRYGFLLSRSIIGFGAALILNFFMQAKLLMGTFFPEFKFENGKMLPLDFENLSLLVVWSFIAGFSEKLVPNIISKAEQKVEVRSDSNPRAANTAATTK